MKTQLLSVIAILSCGITYSQMTVDSHQLLNSWHFTDADESFQELLDISEPSSFDITRQSTVSFEPLPGLNWSATLDQRYTSETLLNGFRSTGSSVLSSNALFRFYEQRHQIVTITEFSLSENTQLRIHGTLLHDPDVDFSSPGGVFLLNGTDFFVGDGDPFFGASASFDPEVAFDFTIELAAGDHLFVLQNFSTGIGEPDNGLLGVNTAWDVTVEVVPAPASALALSLGVVLASRRRR